MGQCPTNCFSRSSCVFPEGPTENVLLRNETPARVSNTQSDCETQSKEDTEAAVKPETSHLFNHPYSLTSMPISTHATTCTWNPCEALQTYPRVFKIKPRIQIETRPSEEPVFILEPALLPKPAYPSTPMPTATSTSTSTPNVNPSEVHKVPGFMNKFVANFRKKYFFRNARSQGSQPWCFRPLCSRYRRSKRKDEVTKPPPPHTTKTTNPVGANQPPQREDVDKNDSEEEVVEKREEREEENEEKKEKVADKEEEEEVEELNTSASLPCQEPRNTLQAEVGPGVSEVQNSPHTIEEYQQSEPSKYDLSGEDCSSSNDQSESLILQSPPEVRNLSHELNLQLMRIFQPENFGDSTFVEDDRKKPFEQKLCLKCHWLDSSSEDTDSPESDTSNEGDPTIAITYLRNSHTSSWNSEEDWITQEGRIDEIIAERPGASGLSYISQHPCCCMDSGEDHINDVPSSKRAIDFDNELENHPCPPTSKGKEEEDH